MITQLATCYWSLQDPVLELKKQSEAPIKCCIFM